MRLLARLQAATDLRSIERARVLLALAAAACIVLGTSFVLAGLGTFFTVGDGTAIIGVSIIGLGLIPLIVGFMFIFIVCQLRLPEGLCSQCGYDLRESADRCPECGGHPEADRREDERRRAVTRRRIFVAAGTVCFLICGFLTLSAVGALGSDRGQDSVPSAGLPLSTAGFFLVLGAAFIAVAVRFRPPVR